MAENNYTLNGRIEVSSTNAYESSGSGTKLDYKEIGISESKGQGESIVSANKQDTLFTLDMSQGSFYTLEIEGLMLDTVIFHKASGTNNTNANGYGKFLPLKSLDYAPVSMENKQFNSGIFQDLFIIEKKKMGVLNIVLLDTSDNKYEKAVTDWFNLCGNDGSRGGYVGYISEWAKVCRYNEFTVRGELSKSYEFMVLPSGDVKTQRAYDNNQLKEVSFTVLIGSDITLIKSNNKR